MRHAPAAVGLLLLAAAPAWPQAYDVRWWSIDAGGAMGRTAGTYVLDSTIGQADAGGPSVGGPYVVHSGFWAIAATGAVGPQADLAVTLTDGTPTAVPGTAVTYTIVASNAGPASVTGATVSDPPPAALGNVTWTCTASAGSSCPAAGSGPLAASVNLLVGGSATFLVTGTIAPTATGTLVNGAAVAPPSGVLDPASANNAASDTDTLTPSADLAVTIADAPDPVLPGGSLAYTLHVANAGPSQSPGMTVTDTLPAAVAFVSASAGCAHAAGVVACTLGSLGPAAGTDVTIQVQVAAVATGTLVDGATVAGAASDPNAGNDADSETTQVLAAPARAEIVHGLRLRADLAGSGGQPDLDVYRIRQQPYASYEVVVDGTSGDIGTGQGPALERVAADGTTVLQSSEPVGAGPSRSLRFMNTTAAPNDAELVRVRSLSCGSGCGADDVYTLRAWETTARVPRFNNAGSQLTVVILHNRSSAPVQGRLYFWSTAGTLLHTEPVALAVRGSTSLNTFAIPALAGQGGSITLVHDAPYDTVDGKAVALEPSTGLAFDSVLESRPR